MTLLRLSSQRLSARSTTWLRRWKSTLQRPVQSTAVPVVTDELGIPLKPTWSVNDLLSSYPETTIDPATLKRLHALSALIPPEEGTPEHAKLTREMQDMVKLVKAVMYADTSAVKEREGEIPDGRVWAEGEGIDLDEEIGDPMGDEASGRELLKHSSRIENDLYVVDAARKR